MLPVPSATRSGGAATSTARVPPHPAAASTTAASPHPVLPPHQGPAAPRGRASTPAGLRASLVGPGLSPTEHTQVCPKASVYLGVPLAAAGGTHSPGHPCVSHVQLFTALHTHRGAQRGWLMGWVSQRPLGAAVTKHQQLLEDLHQHGPFSFPSPSKDPGAKTTLLAEHLGPTLRSHPTPAKPPGGDRAVCPRPSSSACLAVYSSPTESTCSSITLWGN